MYSTLTKAIIELDKIKSIALALEIQNNLLHVFLQLKILMTTNAHPTISCLPHSPHSVPNILIVTYKRNLNSVEETQGLKLQE